MERRCCPSYGVERYDSMINGINVRRYKVTLERFKKFTIFCLPDIVYHLFRFIIITAIYLIKKGVRIKGLRY